MENASIDLFYRICLSAAIINTRLVILKVFYRDESLIFFKNFYVKCQFPSSVTHVSFVLAKSFIIQPTLHQVFDIVYVNFNPLSTKGVSICCMIMHANHQRRIYIYVHKTDNQATMNSLKICIVTAIGIYVRPLFKCLGHQIKIGNILSV